MTKKKGEVTVKEICAKNKYKFLVSIFIAVIGAFLFTNSIPTLYDAQKKISIDASEDKVFKRVDALSMVTQKLGLKEGNVTTEPIIYRKILESPSFLNSLADITIFKKGETYSTPWSEYLQKDFVQPWWRKYTGKKNIKELLRENVKCEVNLHNGIITLQTSAQEPFIAYQLLDSVEQRLQQHLTKYSFDKAKIDVDNRKQELNNSKEIYEKAMSKLNKFLDANKDVVLGSFKIEGSALQKEADKALAKYNQAIQQYQMAKMRLQRTKPYFITLVSSEIPKTPSHPKLLINILIWVFYAVLGTFWWVMIGYKMKIRKERVL